MEKSEAIKVLGEQFNLLAETNKLCEPELISRNIESMVQIYSIIFESRFSQE